MDYIKIAIISVTLYVHLRQTIITAYDLIPQVIFKQPTEESILTFKINLRYLYGGGKNNLHSSSVVFYSWLRK